jgi:hypothetical protein
MAIVVVGGNGRRVGKTALICGLIAAFKEMSWTAVKVTSHEHWKIEPIWEESDAAQGTDTARYLQAGARRAFLLTAPEWHDPNETGLGLVLGEFFRSAGRGANVIFESNRVLYHVQPSLCLMVNGTDPTGKPWFEYAAQRADAVVMRAEADGAEQSAQIDAWNARPTFKLASFEQIAPAMDGWVRQRLTAA